jgi:uncharacterized protein YjbI with pentapeptide repeats
MADPEHVKVARQGLKALRAWRERHASHTLDLHGADLAALGLGGTDLSRADLGAANLHDADLSGCDLRGAELFEANLSRATLRQADLRRADLHRSDLRKADLTSARLAEANLHRALLSGARLPRADLHGARLEGTNLRGVDLRGADLTSAILRHADVSRADLTEARLRQADLRSANFADTNLGQVDLCEADLSRALLAGADLTEAVCGMTTFGDLDLSEAKGLEAVRHLAPSTLGIDTLCRSQGKVPAAFLRGCGVPDPLLGPLRTLTSGLAADPCVGYYLRHASEDAEFVRRLADGLQQMQVRIWTVPGDKEALVPHPGDSRWILVLSEHSLSQPWLAEVLRQGREAERETKMRRLFPLRLIDWPSIKRWTCPAAEESRDLAGELRAYPMPDFSHWKEKRAFDEGLGRLLRELTLADPVRKARAAQELRKP